MAVLVKTPGAPLYAEKLPGGGYQLVQGYAGLGSEGVRAHVMEVPGHAAGDPGVWSAREIGPEGPYGPERFVSKNLCAPIGLNGREGNLHRVKLYHSEPIKPLADVEQAAIAPLPTPPNWTFAVLGAAVGFLGLRWLLRRRVQSNPPWGIHKIGKGQWLVMSSPEEEFVGYVIKMKDGYAALTAKGAVIGKMPSRSAAEALSYGTWSQKFGNEATMIGNPDYKLVRRTVTTVDPIMGEWGRLVEDVVVDNVVIGTVSTTLAGYKLGRVAGEETERPDHPEITRDSDEIALFLIDKYAETVPVEEHEVAVEHAQEEKRRHRKVRGISEAEIDKRILINLKRATRESKSGARVPKLVETDVLAKRVKASYGRVLLRAKALAKAKVIYGVCGYRPVYEQVIKDRVVTSRLVKRAKKEHCRFALLGPSGELGLSKYSRRVPEELRRREGIDKRKDAPEENPEQVEMRFSSGPLYIVKERKPKGCGRDGRMFYEKWETISKHDTLTHAKRAAKTWYRKGTPRRWYPQRAIFLRGTRVSDGDKLLQAHRDLSETPR